MDQAETVEGLPAVQQEKGVDEAPPQENKDEAPPQENKDEAPPQENKDEAPPPQENKDGAPPQENNDGAPSQENNEGDEQMSSTAPPTRAVREAELEAYKADPEVRRLAQIYVYSRVEKEPWKGVQFFTERPPEFFAPNSAYKMRRDANVARFSCRTRRSKSTEQTEETSEASAASALKSTSETGKTSVASDDSASKMQSSEATSKASIAGGSTRRKCRTRLGTGGASGASEASSKDGSGSTSETEGMSQPYVYPAPTPSTCPNRPELSTVKYKPFSGMFTKPVACSLAEDPRAWVRNPPIGRPPPPKGLPKIWVSQNLTSRFRRALVKRKKHEKKNRVVIKKDVPIEDRELPRFTPYRNPPCY